MNYINLDTVKGKKVILEKNEVLFNEKEECESIGYVLTGELEITTNSYFYNDFIISTIHAGETFGENLLFSKSPYYLGTIQATKKTSVLLISKSEYLIFLSNNIEGFLSYTSNKYLKLQERTKILLQKSISEKIMFYLISKSNLLLSNTIPIKSKEALAKYLNIERPSLSRELKKLKEKGIIDYNRNYIIILKSTD